MFTFEDVGDCDGVDGAEKVLLAILVSSNYLSITEWENCLAPVLSFIVSALGAFGCKHLNTRFSSFTFHPGRC